MMTTRKINIEQDVYDALYAEKKADESFTDVVRRLLNFVTQQTIIAQKKEIEYLNMLKTARRN